MTFFYVNDLLFIFNIELSDKYTHLNLLILDKDPRSVAVIREMQLFIMHTSLINTYMHCMLYFSLFSIARLTLLVVCQLCSKNYYGLHHYKYKNKSKNALFLIKLANFLCTCLIINYEPR